MTHYAYPAMFVSAGDAAFIHGVVIVGDAGMRIGAAGELGG
jgi:hypothetical protein